MNLFAAWRRLTGRAKRRPTGSSSQRNRHLRGVELLELRMMLTTNIYLDFGQAIGFGNVIATTIEEFRDVAGPGISSDGTPALGTGPDLTVVAQNVPPTMPLRLQPFSYDYNDDGLINIADLDLLAQAVVDVAEAALKPFDVKILTAQSSSLAEIAAVLASNDADPSAAPDAYVFLGETYGFGLNDWFSFGLFALTRLNGIAARDDLAAQLGNQQDEVALTMLDKIKSDVEDLHPTLTPGSLDYNARLVQRIAYTAIHEAFHTFTFVHSLTPGNDLAQGDVIGKDPFPPNREEPFIVTRFPLDRTELPLGFTQQDLETDNYLLAKSVLGLRDERNAFGQPGANGIPDFAYVTGTGAHDRI